MPYRVFQTGNSALHKGPVIKYLLGWAGVISQFFSINFGGPSKIVNRIFRAHQMLQDLFPDPPILFLALSQQRPVCIRYVEQTFIWCVMHVHVEIFTIVFVHFNVFVQIVFDVSSVIAPTAG